MNYCRDGRRRRHLRLFAVRWNAFFQQKRSGKNPLLVTWFFTIHNLKKNIHNSYPRKILENLELFSFANRFYFFFLKGCWRRDDIAAIQFEWRTSAFASDDQLLFDGANLRLFRLHSPIIASSWRYVITAQKELCSDPSVCMSGRLFCRSGFFVVFLLCHCLPILNSFSSWCVTIGKDESIVECLYPGHGDWDDWRPLHAG